MDFKFVFSDKFRVGNTYIKEEGFKSFEESYTLIIVWIILDIDW